MKIIIVLTASLCLMSCRKEVNQVKKNTDTIDKVFIRTPINSYKPKNSFDWQGTYKGVTPCADCEGIETLIVLNNDLTYSIKTKYLGKGNGKVFEDTGSYIWNKSVGIIVLEGMEGSPSKYKVGENQLIQLDLEGNVISGALAEKYVLTK